MLLLLLGLVLLLNHQRAQAGVPARIGVVHSMEETTSCTRPAVSHPGRHTSLLQHRVRSAFLVAEMHQHDAAKRSKFVSNIQYKRGHRTETNGPPHQRWEAQMTWHDV